MIVLTSSPAAGITERNVRRRDRLAARLQASRLDRKLCSGEAPETSIALALRAQTLVSPAIRDDLAHSLRRVIAFGDRPASPTSSVHVCRAHVHAATHELHALCERLSAIGPISAHGIALVKAILTDGSGPLYQRHSPHDLAAQLQHALDALDELEPSSRGHDRLRASEGP